MNTGGEVVDEETTHEGSVRQGSDVSVESMPSSFEPLQRSRLIPKISFKTMLGLTAAGAMIFAVARSAGEGAALGVGFLAALGYLTMTFLIFSFFFVVAVSFSTFWKRSDPDLLEGSPFADGQLPPQWLEPREKKD